MKLLLLIAGAAAAACAQTSGSNNPYLLRLAHENSGRYACVLLQDTGAFHVEVNTGGATKVFEGKIESVKLHELEHDLQDPKLVSLSQAQIEEPLMRREEDDLQVAVARGGVWQVLSFGSSDSQRPVEHALRPLVRWMDSLHKLPHTNLTEDAGRNNCQPPRVIALTRRSFAAEKPSAAAMQAGRSGPLSTLLRVYSFSVRPEGAHEKCVLVSERGKYRFEDRTQKSEGKPVKTEIFAGRISSGELQQLRELLDAPPVAKMRHREPPGGRVVIMGDILDLTIARPEGDQKLFLSDGYGHQVGAFFGGDGPLGTAEPLMRFLAEHIENNSTATALDRTARNNCAEP